jgi:hypothetical protein
VTQTLSGVFVGSNTWIAQAEALPVPVDRILSNVSLDTVLFGPNTTRALLPLLFDQNRSGTFELRLESGPVGAFATFSADYFGTLDSFVSIEAGTYSFAGQLTSAEFMAPIPEPSTWAIMLIGFMGIGLMTYRRRKKYIPEAATPRC